MDTGCSLKGRAITSRAIGLRTKGKDRAVTSIPRKIRSLLENGSMICPEPAFTQKSFSRSRNRKGSRIMMMNMCCLIFRLLA